MIIVPLMSGIRLTGLTLSDTGNFANFHALLAERKRKGLF